MKKILVTGAGGYIGRHIVKKLCEMNYSIIAVDINTNTIDDRAIKLIYDIFDCDETVYKKLGSPDVCLHLAWQDGFKHNSELHIDKLPSHYRFLRYMLEGGLKHIAIMGTMHEIGYWEGEIDENTPANPLTYYGIAKNALRQLVKILVNDKDIVFQWLRAFYIYGDDIYNNSIFSKILKMEREGKSTFPFTTGKNKFDFISIDELSTQIAYAVTQDKISGIINCCSGKPMALKERIEQFIKENGLKIRPEYGAYPERPYESPAIWGSNDKILRILSSKG